MKHNNLIKVYVAGPYSANNVIDVLKNIGRGEKACAKLFVNGFAPFCPWHDKSFVTDNSEYDFTVEQFYDYSLAWLKVSDLMLVLDGWKDSKGTLEEMKVAKELNIPIFFDIEEVIECKKHLSFSDNKDDFVII